ncbi:MAG: M20/M25/M40 family metallo-hydrolase [bacterium]|nr:M20/M25/M40 family metallo-hydrolase [bacterium]
MSAGRLPIRAYTSEELRLLAAEGRLKGRGVEGLVNLRPHRKGTDRQVPRAAFEAMVSRLSCWTEPLALLHTFLDLVGIPSPPGQETGVALFLAKRLRTLGLLEIRRDGSGNLMARLPATSPKAPSLLFTAHMDCVYPGNGTFVQPVFCVSGEIRTDGRNSLGADDKAGISAILATLAYIRDAQLAHGEIRVLFTVQEELGFRGMKQVPASILDGVHLVVSMDPPVRVEREETAHLAVLHMPPSHPFVHLVRQAAGDCGLTPQILYAEDGYVGGDTICLSPLGALVVDFCSGSRYPHTPHEHLHFQDLLDQTSWMSATVERVLAYDSHRLALRSVYGDELIGTLAGVRKPLAMTAKLLEEKLALARSLHQRAAPDMVPALVHLSAVATRLGDMGLLKAVVSAYGRCVQVGQVPQVLRDLTLSMVHFISGLADARPVQPLVSVAQEVVERGGDERARIHALHFLEAVFQKERRVVQKAQMLRRLVLCLQSNSPGVVDGVTQFFRAHLDDTIHALTVAFCHRNRVEWERIVTPAGGRLVGARGRFREEGAAWTLVRQRILQLLLEEDRILPDMLEWIFTHDGAAMQKIAGRFVDPSRTGRIAGRILQNLNSREPAIQETAVQFVGQHRMRQAIDPLIDVLLTPYLCRNRELVEWALDAIGRPALGVVIGRLGNEAEFSGFVRRMFNRHDASTEVEFRRLSGRLNETYGRSFRLDDSSQLTMLGHYIGRQDLDRLDELSLWDKRRAIVFYEHLSRLYPSGRDLERLAEVVEDTAAGTHAQFIQMALQRNIFEDVDFMNLVVRENPRFLEHFMRMERQVSRHALLLRLREFMMGAQVDMADVQDVEVYYLYLLKQSAKMPDRGRYLKHIEQARRYLFPQVKPYCKAFTIAGDRIEEVGTVDRQRIRALIASLPDMESRADRLRNLLVSDVLARRERQRLINALSDTFGIDVTLFNTLEDRADAVLGGIDFEFDSAYRPVPQVVFPHLLRVRMKHRNDVVVGFMLEYALEYALVNHPEIRSVLESGELDLVLDNLNDLLTDRVYEAERDLSEDVFEELHEKHVAALVDFYTSQWKSIVRGLKKEFPSGRPAEMISKTEQAMLEYNVRDEDGADLLDTNLNRLVQVLRPADANLLTFHLRHRECYKVYVAVLRARNIRQLKRIYREVYLLLQDEISFAGREHGEKKVELQRTPAAPGYLKYARKELGKLGKLMSDFVLERALEERVQAVQVEITKLRQVVVGTSQILCAPSKDVSIVYRSWPGNDCNMGNIQQVLCPDCSFYKIIADGDWKGYFTLVEVRRKNERAFLLDVLNYSGLRMENQSFVKVLLHYVIQIAQAEGIEYVLTSSYDTHISNRDYIRRAFHKEFPALGTVQNFALVCTPVASFQSLMPNLSVIWKNKTAES